MGPRWCSIVMLESALSLTPVQNPCYVSSPSKSPRGRCFSQQPHFHGGKRDLKWPGCSLDGLTVSVPDFCLKVLSCSPLCLPPSLNLFLGSVGFHQLHWFPPLLWNVFLQYLCIEFFSAFICEYYPICFESFKKSMEILFFTIFFQCCNGLLLLLFLLLLYRCGRFFTDLNGTKMKGEADSCALFTSWTGTPWWYCMYTSNFIYTFAKLMQVHKDCDRNIFFIAICLLYFLQSHSLDIKSEHLVLPLYFLVCCSVRNRNY